jgi:transcriptional regulator with XRE-family HTH domain
MKKQKTKTLEAVEIGARIRSAREAAKMTQPALAVKCKWLDKEGNPSQSRVSNYESGDREPGLKEIRLLSKALAKPVSYFYTGKDVLDLGALPSSRRVGVELFLDLDEDQAAKLLSLAELAGLKE